jgi:hypothetical protein
MDFRSHGAQSLWIIVVLLASCAVAQERPNPDVGALRGNWIATAGPTRFFRGFWSGEILPGTHNAAKGSWTLLGDRGQILLEGTWSAKKSDGAWQGTWSARVTRGRSFSGSWNAAIADSGAKTFEDMLKQTFEKQVSGSWQSGRLQGNWQLQGSR